MSTFLINGIEKDLPVSWESPLNDLIQYAQKNFNSDQSLVSSFKLNGLEISPSEEVTLGGIPLSSLKTVEIETVHPKELAEDTLQSLLPFLNQLSDMSLRTGAANTQKEFQDAYGKLIDGIATFFDAVGSARQILKIQPEENAGQICDRLTDETTAIMKDMLNLYEASKFELMRAALSQRMPALFARWKADGVPALIRSRDS
ncbi:MAG TPA: hypothetical protein VM598_00940 [Bdellovibrionota bacterium]|nr:hypothetical protein [Bdellovibrionota bacterium]